MQGAGVNYVVPFIILGGKGLLYLAAFTGLPALAGAVLQWFGATMTDSVGQRNRILIPTVIGQASTWLPICVAIFLPFDTVGYWVMLVAYITGVALANFSVPAWQSLMGDIVPAERRGRYFGLRNAVSGAVLVGAFFGAGAWLTLCQRTDWLGLFGLTGRNFGFLTLFTLAGAVRFLSAWFLTRVYEPAYQHARSDSFSLLEFMRRAPKAHFGRFVFYCLVMNMGLGFVGPFLGWYLLSQLGFTPAGFATVLAAGMLAGVISQPLWGRLIDRFGSKRILAIGGIAVVFTPLLLLSCSTFSHFVAVMIYDGISTAAFNIAVGNYLFDVVTPPKRARCAAAYNVFVAVGATLGNFGGALVGEFTPLPLVVAGITLSRPFAAVLLCAAAVRLLGNILLLRSFEEFRLRRPAFN